MAPQHALAEQPRQPDRRRKFPSVKRSVVVPCLSLVRDFVVVQPAAADTCAGPGARVFADRQLAQPRIRRNRRERHADGVRYRTGLRVIPAPSSL